MNRTGWRNAVSAALLCASVAASGCQSGGTAARGVRSESPLFEGMGRHHRAIKTSSALAHRYFNQGLTWAYAFNHDEAIRSFRDVLRQDPDCAMAYWGIALCNGPHINNPVVPPARSKEAWEALQQALARKDSVGAVDQALIMALSHRYAAQPPEDRRALDEAYAAAMREVWYSHRDDADVGALYAEAMMDLQPWDLWSPEGAPKGNTTEIVAVLEEVIDKSPEHPGALHFYIHAVEASPAPERALLAANRLRELVPAAGHLVHMPAHIDVRTGNWAEASDANERAIRADAHYRGLSPKQDFYRVYMAHNHHFLAYAAMMEGRSMKAIEAARAMIAGIPASYVAQNGALVDPYSAIVYEVLMRFGRWSDVLNEPRPPADLPITTALWRFARAVSYAAKGLIDDAQREQVEFRAAVARVPDGAMMAMNPADVVLSIAEHMLAGEIAYRRGYLDQAERELREAIRIEDTLRYMEPPDWVQPVRHTLAAILLEAGRTSDAEVLYREDLQRWPENGWSLYGLGRCLRARGADDEAAQIEQRFARAWRRADIKIAASCLCVK
ncbi:MAG: hypothetical protein CHACPFDD_00257 [Phycisphaerae bacterium]|nr:hypothetical protein [Phycisphaerae bacterium]